MNEPNKFEYNYSVPTERERKEAEVIRDYYSETKSGSKIERLRRMDAKAKTPPMVWSLSLGIVGLLIFGGGLSMVMLLSKWYYILLGCVIAVTGILPIGAAYPVFKVVTKKSKEKYGKEILQLSEEIINENRE